MVGSWTLNIGCLNILPHIHDKFCGQLVYADPDPAPTFYFYADLNPDPGPTLHKTRPSLTTMYVPYKFEMDEIGQTILRAYPSGEEGGNFLI